MNFCTTSIEEIQQECEEQQDNKFAMALHATLKALVEINAKLLPIPESAPDNCHFACCDAQDALEEVLRIYSE